MLESNDNGKDNLDIQFSRCGGQLLLGLSIAMVVVADFDKMESDSKLLLLLLLLFGVVWSVS